MVVTLRNRGTTEISNGTVVKVRNQYYPCTLGCGIPSEYFGFALYRALTLTVLNQIKMDNRTTKYKNNFHQDYDPCVVVSSTKSSLVKGAVVQLRFKKVNNLTLLERLLRIINVYKTKDIYYWLPYKSVVDASDKYSVKGSNARFPYSAIWFEVKENSEIYKQGLEGFKFRRVSANAPSQDVRLTHPFMPNELLTLTRKKVIRMLDNHIFNKTINNK